MEKERTDLLQKEVDRKILQLRKMTEVLKSHQQNYPDGSLRIDDKKRGTQFYQYTGKKTGKSNHYIGKKEIALVEALAQKDYEMRLLQLVEEQLQALENLKGKYNPVKIKELYTELSEARKGMVNPLVLPDEEYVKQWKAAEYQLKTFAPGETEYYTDTGIRVRSKSEILIGNRLDSWGIPYRYEYPVLIDKSYIVHPDFMALNVRTRKEYYWEHCGKMQDEGYKDDMVRRNGAYIRNGIIPGVNLIYSFESNECPLNMKSVDKLIESFLI